MQVAKSFVQHPPRHLREPVVEGAKNAKKDSPDNDVMEMRDNEVRTCKLPIEGRRAKHDACEAGNQKLEQKRDTEEHRCFELDLSTPHRCQPVENLDPRRNRNRHRCEYKVGVRV